MKQPEQSLYPKLSSIYNKILQLASAILLIIVLMSMWQSIHEKDKVNLAQHFNYVAKQYINQAGTSTAVLLSKKYTSKTQRNIALQSYVDSLLSADFVKQVHLYDKTGFLLFAGRTPVEGEMLDHSQSIIELYGVSSDQKANSDQYTPFVVEVRDTQLRGYLRFTIEATHLTQVLSQADQDRQTVLRLMLLMAGLVGFLLTRGLNRFSRQGYRLAQPNTVQSNETT